MKNDTFIVAVVFAFLLGLIIKPQPMQPVGQEVVAKKKIEINQTELICLAKNVYYEIGRAHV